jgi:hypothetical protein
MSPPKQVRAISSNTKRSHENDLKNLPCVIIKTCENDDYNQEYKIVYDFDDDDHVALHKSHKEMPDDDDNFFDVNENEYNNAALARSCKVVTGKRIDCDGYNGIVHENAVPLDPENVESQDVDEPSPFFVNDDEHHKYEEDEFEDGDWIDENEIEYYIDDCW